MVAATITMEKSKEQASSTGPSQEGGLFEDFKHVTLLCSLTLQTQKSIQS